MKKEVQDKKDGKHVLHLIINGQKYDWTHQYITGAQIRKLGNIPNEDEIFLKIKEPWRDELIKDDTSVDLARPGLEHFFSKTKFPIVIFVNVKEKPWSKEKISYDEVVKLAYESYVDNGTTAYTVTYHKGPKQNPEGTMVKGDSVSVKNKMDFIVTATNKS